MGKVSCQAAESAGKRVKKALSTRETSASSTATKESGVGGTSRFGVRLEQKEDSESLTEWLADRHDCSVEVGEPALVADSVLMRAARDGDVQLLISRLRMGCNPNLVNRKGWTPLIVAAASNQFECAEALIRWGAVIDMVVKGTTAQEEALSRFNTTGRPGYLRLSDLLSGRRPLDNDDYKEYSPFKKHPINMQMNDIQEDISHLSGLRCQHPQCQAKVVVPYAFCGGATHCLMDAAASTSSPTQPGPTGTAAAGSRSISTPITSTASTSTPVAATTDQNNDDEETPPGNVSVPRRGPSRVGVSADASDNQSTSPTKGGSPKSRVRSPDRTALRVVTNAAAVTGTPPRPRQPQH